jgi:thiosulfate/3-mercaptopyruvate sulfurtransferase
MRKLFPVFALALLAGAVASAAPAEAVRGSMVVTPAWVADHLRDPDLVLLQVGEKKDFDAGHLPGARFVTLDTISVRDTVKDLTLQLPPVATLVDRLEALGISDTSRIVIYFATNWVTPTTRVYFTLDYLGLGDRTSIMDGGLPAWRNEHRPVTTDSAEPPKGRLTPHPRAEVVADLDYVKANFRSAGTVVVDARALRFYEGRDPGSMPRAGRIPGARNIPFSSLVTDNNMLKDADTLRGLFVSAGAGTGKTVVTYCHIGQQASLAYFVARYLGYPARLYDGSFEEWSHHPELPVEAISPDQMPATHVVLVTPESVAQHANDAGVRILDVRANPYDYFAGHVPNAVHLPEGTLRGPLSGVPAQYNEMFMLVQVLARAGVRSTDRVVVYSDGMDVLGATMFAYVLERIGQRDVAVMDGGWSAFKASQRAVQTYPTYGPGALDPTDERAVTAVTLDQLKGLMGKPGVTIVDARPAAAYRGDTAVWMRNGHIPGAINLEWRSLTDGDNAHKLKPIDELRAIVAARGLKASDDIVVYCGTGREASLEYMVLKHLLGFTKVRLYEGSWGEYAAHAELPVATGTAAGTHPAP